jgi:hypothetical protein
MSRKIEGPEQWVPPQESVHKSLGDRLLTEKDAADFLRISRSWLAKARMKGDGPERKAIL